MPKPSFIQPNEAERRDFSWGFWAALLLTGAAAGAAAGLLMRLLFWVEDRAWPYGRASVQFTDAVGRSPWGRRVLLLILAGAIAAAGRLLLRRRGAGGHGGEVTEEIWFGEARMPFFTTIGRAVLSIVVVGIGAALGREGAVKQTGAALASAWGGLFRLDRDQRRLLLACGVGAGIAAAYNVPFAGAIFAMEVLLGTLAISQVIPAMVASVLATAVSWIFLPNEPIYPALLQAANLPTILWAVAAGPVLGLAGVSYIRGIAWADARRPQGAWKIVSPVVAMAALAVVALGFPQILGNGKDVVDDVLRLRYGTALLLVLALLRFGASGLCLGAGIPGGLFTPTLACGTLLGGFFGRVGALLGGGVDPVTCAIAGGGAFVAAATEGPVSAVVFMIELTRNIQPAAVPLILAVAGAVLVSRALETRSIYSARIREAPDRRPAS